MWDEMIRARQVQDKANELLQQALNTEEDAAIENKRKSKKPQVVKAQSKHALVLPLKFTISGPGARIPGAVRRDRNKIGVDRNVRGEPEMAEECCRQE